MQPGEALQCTHTHTHTHGHTHQPQPHVYALQTAVRNFLMDRANAARVLLVEKPEDVSGPIDLVGPLFV